MFGIGIKKLNPFSRIAAREALGIEFSANYVKIVHVKMRPNATGELVDVFGQNIAGQSDDDIVKSVKSACSHLRAKIPDVVCIIPSNLIITKNIEIPSTDPAEIKEIINLQAGRHTPHARDEIIIDYIDVGIYKRSYTKALLIIVSHAVVRKYVNILDRAGFRTERVLFAPEGMALSVLKILRYDIDNAPVNIIHIDESDTDFSVIFRNKVMFVRSIPVGAQHLIHDREKCEARFAAEIKSSIEAYQAEDIEKNPASAVITGAVEEIRGLDSVLGALLPYPVRVIPYDRNLPILISAVKDNPPCRYVSFLGIIATLFSYAQMKVNLIPEEIRMRKVFEERGKELIKTGIFALSFFILIFSIFMSKLYFKATVLDKLDRQYKTVNTEAEKLEGDFTKISAIKNYLLKRGYPLEILTELYAVIPPDIELQDIRYEDESKFTTRGTAESMSSVFAFVDSMEKSKFFKDVKTRYTTKRKKGLKDVTDFEIVSSLEKAAGE
ncbi:MAG: pilus assembly protein PilM [Candidatus Omnitrophota bacterium]